MLISLISLEVVSFPVRLRSTATYNYTVTYNPVEDCLPYDGSVVPDCSKYVNPVTKQPYYHEHSNSEKKHFFFQIRAEPTLLE